MVAAIPGIAPGVGAEASDGDSSDFPQEARVASAKTAAATRTDRFIFEKGKDLIRGNIARYFKKFKDGLEITA
jgi:hypothetical protein